MSNFDLNLSFSVFKLFTVINKAFYTTKSKKKLYFCSENAEIVHRVIYMHLVTFFTKTGQN